ncbi:MAG: two-component system response regulator [Planctomycetaceae bacterium]|nr:two-component system response regulator [Planctomycetaceae bacterium]
MPNRQATILLLEEEPTLAEITAFRLELLGHRVQAFDNGQAAIDWLAGNSVDLIAVGHLADIESIELLNRFSDDQSTSHLPLVYLSANSDLTEVQRAFNAGADEYLVTPYDPFVLEQKVEGLLRASAGPGKR